MLVLGIETSCDETSVAVLEDGRVRAAEIYSQKAHGIFGGVVPEIASRAHIRKIDRLCGLVLDKAGVTIPDINLIAVTDSPGLAGALLVGISFALGLHAGSGIPITGIHHLEGHICAIFLEHPQMRYPFLALVVSGGHTAIYKVEDYGRYACLGRTVDDAAGEAFDKIGKMLGFDYPAGAAIEKEAEKCDDSAGLSFPVARVAKNALDFSFSGLKTAVKYYCAQKDPEYIERNRPQICRAFQKAVVDSLTNNVFSAAQSSGIRDIALVGGVACNNALRRALSQRTGYNVFFPSPTLCTDNAAMIARAGFEAAQRSLTRFPDMDPSRQL